MTKADLIDEVSRLAELTRKDSEVIVETIFDSIVRSLRVGDKIEIRGFGSFRTRQRKPFRTDILAIAQDDDGELVIHKALDSRPKSYGLSEMPHSCVPFVRIQKPAKAILRRLVSDNCTPSRQLRRSKRRTHLRLAH